MKRLIALASVLAAVAAADAVTLEVSGARQRYPWNGKVDIDYSIVLSEGEAPLDAASDRIEALAVDESDSPARTNVLHVFEPAVLPLSAGSHRVTWDAKAEGLDFASGDFKVVLSVCHYAPKYLVIDVSAGKDALSYPVAYLDGTPTTPGGFNAEKYKGDSIVLHLIPAGSFVMGSPATGDEGGKNVRIAAREVQHPVTLTRPYYIGLFEITQKQYFNVTGAEPSTYAGPYRPVEKVSYGDIRGTNKGSQWPDGTDVDETTFLGLLRDKTGLSLDLPTDAQWEYACRAGTVSAFNDGSAYGTGAMARLGCFKDNPGIDGKHTVVGSYQANAWGLYDMHGNVGEWCLDFVKDAVETLGQRIDPVGPDANTRQGNYRILRGGCHSDGENYCRSANRWYEYGNPNTARSDKYGFRIALTLK